MLRSARSLVSFGLHHAFDFGRRLDPGRALGLAGLLLACASYPVMAQDVSNMSPSEASQSAAEPPVPLYDGIGELTRDVTTSNDSAQAYFNQGLRLTYGFGHGEAVRSFRQAQRHDPACAACFWGEAWALGPNINAPMNPSNIPDAVAAATAALERVDQSSELERALIEAMAVRYVEDPGEGERAALDSAYVEAMEDVAERFPNDIEVLTLLGEAHMILRPWDYWSDNGDPQPGVERPIEILERALDLDIEHPGACHLYIHLVEASPAPERAEPCAEFLAAAIPGVSHVPHMPSHIWMRIGRYGDAVRGNQEAWIADQRAESGGPPGVYTTHNLHMLAFAASFDGQSAVAIRAAKDLARLSTGSSFYVPLTLLRFGHWHEILELPIDETSDFRAGVHHFARGLARLRTGDRVRAGIELEALSALRAGLPEDARFRGHLQSDLLGIAEGVLEGEVLAADGEDDRAIAALERAVAFGDGLEYDEPEPWTIPPRHHLGAVLLEAGLTSQAEEVYRAALAIHPNAGWSLRGLADALRAQGRNAEADAVEAEFREAWARADVWIDGSRF